MTKINSTDTLVCVSAENLAILGDKGFKMAMKDLAYWSHKYGVGITVFVNDHDEDQKIADHEVPKQRLTDKELLAICGKIFLGRIRRNKFEIEILNDNGKWVHGYRFEYKALLNLFHFCTNGAYDVDLNDIELVVERLAISYYNRQTIVGRTYLDKGVIL